MMMDKVKAIQWACYGVGISYLIVPAILLSHLDTCYGDLQIWFGLDYLLIVVFLISSGYFLTSIQTRSKISAIFAFILSCLPVIAVYLIFRESSYGVSGNPIWTVQLFLIIYNIPLYACLHSLFVVNRPKKPSDVEKELLKQPDSPIEELPWMSDRSEKKTPEDYEQPKKSEVIDISSCQRFIDQYLKNQKNPLENIEKFYKYLTLKKIDLTTEMKKEIRKRIEDFVIEQKNKSEEEALSKELFGTGSESASVNISPARVSPLPVVPPGSSCQVCLSEFSSAEPGAVACPHCNNLFHYRCITKWVNKNHSCPLCKKELSV